MSVHNDLSPTRIFEQTSSPLGNEISETLPTFSENSSSKTVHVTFSLKNSPSPPLTRQRHSFTHPSLPRAQTVTHIINERGSYEKGVHSKPLLQRTLSNGTMIVQNPVYQKSFSSELPYFTSMPTLSKYDEGKAAHELSQCVQRHSVQLLPEIVKIVAEVERNTKPGRFQQVLIHAFSNVENVAFFTSYFQENETKINQFVAEAVRQLIASHFPDLFSILSVFTKADLKVAKSDSLFREGSFSAALCREYGTHLMKQKLKELDDKVLGALDKVEPHALWFDRHGYVYGQPVDSDDLQRIQKFHLFAKELLTHIYTMEFPEEFARLLRQTHAHILDFAHEKKVGNPIAASRIYLADIFFLRIVNRHLMKLFSPNSIKWSVVLQLTKVLQCLAKEAKFDAEKANPLYEPLNPLFKEFVDKHRLFIDNQTLKKSDEATQP